jgi:[ribosomal protein S5]-alanine N-acetyltransferase
MLIKLELLSECDAHELFNFECSNREFFEKSVPTRGNDYYQYEYFSQTMNELLQEQKEGISYFYLIKGEDGEIVGRINLVDTVESGTGRTGHLGYRIGEDYIGKGVASKAVSMLLEKLPHEYGIHEVHAKTTLENYASQKVLEKNQFSLVAVDEDKNLTNAFMHYIWKSERF